MKERNLELSNRDYAVIGRQELFIEILEELKAEFGFEIAIKRASGRTGKSVNEVIIVASKQQFNTNFKFKVELRQFAKLISCELEVDLQERKSRYTLYIAKFSFNLEATKEHIILFLKTQFTIGDGFLYA